MATAFKAYDIRGVWGKDIDSELAYKIGFFLPEILQSEHILVGRDIRNSSDPLFEALSNGITDAGSHITDAGLSTTPMIYWATGFYGYTGSVMITASHNPKNHNGLKVSGDKVKPIGYDNGLNKLEELIRSKPVNPTRLKGTIYTKNLIPTYIRFLKQYQTDLSALKLAVDCSNGMAALIIKDLIGEDHLYINDTMDGNFPGHEPNPLEPINQQQIKQLVVENNCDIGLIFDGDADRVMFIDEQGQFISPDLIIALMGHYFFEKRAMHGDVLQDIRSSRSVSEYLNTFGATMHTWRVGRAYGAGKLKEIDGLYGGELAGHYYFREFYYSDSAMMAALIVLQLIQDFKTKGIPLSQLIQRIQTFENTGEMNFKINAKQQAMDAVVQHFMDRSSPQNYMDFDGYRLDYPDFWLNIRPSNTEPYLRFIAEARSKEKLEEIKETVISILNRYR